MMIVGSKQHSQTFQYEVGARGMGLTGTSKMEALYRPVSLQSVILFGRGARERALGGGAEPLVPSS